VLTLSIAALGCAMTLWIVALGGIATAAVIANARRASAGDA
jgi:hypothetical protein